MSEKKPELKPDEQASLQALRNLEKFEESKGDMDHEFEKLDDECVELARDFAPQSIAGSIWAANTGAELMLKRRERDAVRYSWRRQYDRLESVCERLTMPTISKFADTCQSRAQQIFKKREVSFERGLGEREIGRREVRISSNFESVRQAIALILGHAKTVKAMHLQPLHLIREKIRELNAEFERIALVFEPSDISEAMHHELQQFEADAEHAYEERTIPTRQFLIGK